ncbi:MAG: hypothetical protein ACR2QE_04570, partial [Acidimicrobiales bacterium]
MKRVTLHIGLHKTGTTMLQALCARNRDALSDQGLLYPSTGGQDGVNNAHRGLMLAARRDDGAGA